MFYNMLFNIGQKWTKPSHSLPITFVSTNKGVRRKPNRVATKTLKFMKRIFSFCFLLAALILTSMPALATNDSNSCPPPKGVTMVDLGLSVKWADRNVGATSVDDYGVLYMWGTCNPNLIDSEIGYTPPNLNTAPVNICGTKFDVARVKWGAPYRLPSKKELKELKTLCKWEWTEKDNTEGWLVTGPNGNSIYLPAAGYKLGNGIEERDSWAYYWSGTLVAPKDRNAYMLDARKEGFWQEPDRKVGFGGEERILGCSIRPIASK